MECQCQCQWCKRRRWSWKDKKREGRHFLKISWSRGNVKCGVRLWALWTVEPVGVGVTLSLTCYQIFVFYFYFKIIEGGYDLGEWSGG